MKQRTTRQSIAHLLRVREGVTPSTIASHISDANKEWKPDEVIDQIHQIKHSLDSEQVLAAPPYCKDCGFDGFDRPGNIPSKCPECYSLYLGEPRFTIE